MNNIKKSVWQVIFRLAGIFCAAVVTASAVLFVLPVNGEENLFGRVVRLHVIAASDTERDQTVKLAVRDRILAEFGSRLPFGADNAAQAAKILDSLREEIRISAEETVRAWGSSDTVTVSVGTETFPEKQYGGLCFPAGDYRALCIRIGRAEGHNWWCVLFPPLCVRTSMEYGELPSQSVFVTDDCTPLLHGAGFTEAEEELLTESTRPHIKIRFKLLELFSAWFGGS